MSKILLKKIPDTVVDIPDVGSVTIFFDIVGDCLSYKLSDGTVVPIGDKSYKMDVVATTSVVVNHNLQKIPSVTCIDDSSGVLIQPDATIYSVSDITNSLTVMFTSAFTGTIICN